MIDKFKFKPVHSGRLVEDIVLQIEAGITAGDIQIGERLPSERQLQGIFETGRGVIREALSILKQKGLIEIKKGAHGGAFVKEIDVVNISQSLSLFMTQRAVSPESVVEFRETIDRMIAVLAVTRSDRDKREKLLRLAESFKLYISNGECDSATIGEMDRELNGVFAELSGNPVIEWVMNALQLGFSSYDYALYEDEEYRIKTAANWVNTARELYEGESMKALSYVSNHYLLLRSCIREKGDSIEKRDLDFSELTTDGDAGPEDKK